MLVERVVLLVGEVVIGCEEKSAGSASWVGNGFVRFQAHAGHHRLDERAGGEVLACGGFGVFGVLFEQPFVNGAFGVYTSRSIPIFADNLDIAD